MTTPVVLAAALVACGTPAPGPVSSERALAADMVGAARRFLASLTPAQRARVMFPVSAAARLDWHFIPKPRPGITLGELDDAQRALAFGFLATALGRPGFLKATSIMALEEVLRRAEGGRGAFVRDAGAYHVTVFGEPALDATWGWRVEGHHLSLNLTLVDGHRVVHAPAFFGAAPARVKGGYLDELRVFAREEALGFRLFTSLSPEAQAAARYAVTAPEDILTGPGAALDPLPGLVAHRMSPAQRAILDELVDEALANLPRELAVRERMRLDLLDRGRVVFTWAGGHEPGEPHYYRLHGPSFVFEYDNTQQGANHAHAVWHALAEGGGDFGLDWLRRHHRDDHGSAR